MPESKRKGCREGPRQGIRHQARIIGVGGKEPGPLIIEVQLGLLRPRLTIYYVYCYVSMCIVLPSKPSVSDSIRELSGVDFVLCSKPS